MMHAFENHLLHQPGVDQWFEHIGSIHGANWRLQDREGMARLLANSYAMRFLYHSAGVDVPRFGFTDSYFEVNTPETLAQLVDWCLETGRRREKEIISFGKSALHARQQREQAVTAVGARLLDLFEVVDADHAPWAADVERQLMFQVANELLLLTQPPA